MTCCNGAPVRPVAFRATVTDIQFHGTPADWARHAGHRDLSEWLRSKERPQ